jgi:ligand-binding sensor domain-containing protein/signal transduction histidine kinase/CheY-like chemotaxis protein
VIWTYVQKMAVLLFRKDVMTVIGRIFEQAKLPWLVALLCVVFFFKGQAAEETSPEYLHRTWQSEEGLPNPVVRAVMQSKDGYLWLGTDECLARFDGVKFTEFDRKEIQNRHERWMVGLCEGKDGSLWVSSCNGGIIRLKDGVTSRYTIEHGLATNYVLSAYEDTKGNVWVGTARGLARLEGERMNTFPNTEGLIFRTDGSMQEAVRTIIEDRKGNIWIGTAGGLSIYKDGKFTAYTTTNLLANASVMALLEARDGSMWIGTSGGLSHLKDGKLTHYTTDSGLAHDTVRAIHEDASGNVWIGTHGGLQRFIHGEFFPVKFRDTLSLESGDHISDHVYCIEEDREGNLWIGTNVGLRRLRQQKFKIYSKQEGMPHEQATAVLQDQSGAMWIATFGGGLTRYHNNEFITFDTNNLPSNYILGLCETRDGALWIGTDLHGVIQLKDGEFTQFKAKATVAFNTVRIIIEGRDGKIWIASNTGVSTLETFMKGRPVRNLEVSGPRAMIEDSQGNLWIGTKTGLIRWKDGERQNYTEKDGLTSSWVNALYEDADGAIWIGTELGGLNRFKGGKFTSFGEAQNFKERILHILEDGGGNFWLGTKGGVFSLRRNEINAFLDGKKSRVNVVSYGKADGMRRAQCNGIGQPCGWESTDGRLWFPTLFGVAAFTSTDVAGNTVPPSVVVEKVIADKLTVHPSLQSVFPPGSGDVEFHYTGLSFTVPEKVRFLYKLDEVDTDWHDAGTRRVARYSNLHPGEYTFRVKACNNDGVWNENGAAYSFSIEPHFYETAAFYALCAATLIIFGTGLYQLRLRHLRTREQELLEQVNERTKELRQEITERKHAQRRSAVFSKLGQFLSLAKSTEDAAKTIVDAADELIGWDACSLYSYDVETDQGTPVLFYDLVNGNRERVTTDGILGNTARRTLKDGAQLILRKEPVASSPEYLPFGDRSRPSASLIFVPIRTGNKVVGILSVQSYKANAYGENDLTTIQALADYCGGAFERLRAEAALQESRQMVLRQERLAAVGQLSAGVAHEFNNILTVVKGHANLLLENQRLGEDVTQSLTQIATSADRAANLTRQMLAFSRKQLMQPRAIDLNDVAVQVTKMLGRVLGENISLCCNFAQKLPPIYADVGMMEQILMNLALNARDAMPRGGQLAITTEAVQISEPQLQGRAEAYTGRFVQLKVADTGSGMDEVTLQRIFEPFFTTKEVGKGTGLGLSTVYGIVKQHQGWIEVDSSKGKGTTFNIFLPVHVKPVTQKSGQSAAPAVRGGRETILFVEDEADIRKLARQVLEYYGYRVFEASSGVDALKKWEQHKEEINLLLTDMVMPEGVSGGELARRLRAEKPSLKVIYSSGYSVEILEKDFSTEKNFRFLEKPYKPQKLAEMVRDCFDSPN